MQIYRCLLLISLALFDIQSAAWAQARGSVSITPSNPTSADTIVVSYLTYPEDALFVRNAYRVSMTNNRIKFVLGEAPPGPIINVDLSIPIDMRVGMLPAGNYVVDLYRAVTNSPDVAASLNIPLTVTDDRAAKVAPFVRLNYSDHWWKPSESGWGLFVWHDRLDRVLAAWFTYGADGKPIWYTVQLGQWTTYNTYEGQVIQSTGPSFLNFAPGSTVGVQSVGTAKLVFSDANTGTFTYSVQNVTQSKVITRFRP